MTLGEEEKERERGLRFAVRSLAAKDQPSFELRKKLRERNLPPKIVEAVLGQLHEWGYVNDERWLDNFIQGQLSKHYGPRAILQKLVQKGVEREKAQQAVDFQVDEEQQRQAVRQLLEGRFKKYNLNDPKEKQKAVAALVRRGFSMGLIFSLIN